MLLPTHSSELALAPLSPPPSSTHRPRYFRSALIRSPWPLLRVEPASLTTCIPHSTYRALLAPWNDPVFADQDGVPRCPVSECPPWSTGLEWYYKAFVTPSWVELAADLDSLNGYASDYARWRRARTLAREEGVEFDDVHDDEDLEISFVLEQNRDAAYTLSRKLYSLHYVRERFLNFHRQLNPGVADDTSLHSLANELNVRPPAPITAACIDSLWPFESPLPPKYARRLVPHILEVARLPAAAQKAYFLPKVALPAVSASPALPPNEGVLPAVDELYSDKVKRA